MSIENISVIGFDKFVKIIKTTNKIYPKLNELFLMGFERYDEQDMMNLIKQINPLLLTSDVRKLADIEDPYESNYKTFVSYVVDLEKTVKLTETL